MITVVLVQLNTQRYFGCNDKNKPGLQHFSIVFFPKPGLHPRIDFPLEIFFERTWEVFFLTHVDWKIDADKVQLGENYLVFNVLHHALGSALEHDRVLVLVARDQVNKSHCGF